MPIHESPGAGSAVARPSCARVSADLRLTPQAPDQYQVVLTFRHSDGQLYEAVLTPLAASVLASEIADALHEGDRSASRPDLELRASARSAAPS